MNVLDSRCSVLTSLVSGVPRMTWHLYLIWLGICIWCSAVCMKFGTRNTWNLSTRYILNLIRSYILWSFSWFFQFAIGGASIMYSIMGYGLSVISMNILHNIDVVVIVQLWIRYKNKTKTQFGSWSCFSSSSRASSTPVTPYKIKTKQQRQ